MNILIYALYALWVILAIALKIVASASWWIALSWLWFPLGVGCSLALALTISVDLGKYFKKKEDSKIPDSCEVCLFGKSAEYAPDEKCLGEIMDDSHKKGTTCPYYKKFIK